jgi:hypothetical protein
MQVADKPRKVRRMAAALAFSGGGKPPDEF